MSDSSDEGSDFINGLKELGLFDEEMTETKKSSTEKKSKPKPKKSQPKKRPPKRKPINIDDIMKSMDIPVQSTISPLPAAEPSIYSTPIVSNNQPSPAPKVDSYLQSIKQDSTPSLLSQMTPPSTSPQYISHQPLSSYQVQPQINLSIFENRILDYLNKGLRTITDEFSLALTQLFGVNSEIDEIVANYLDSIKTIIREEINFSFDFKHSMLNCFDPFAPRFRSTYFDIEQIKNASIPEKITELRNATAAISSYIPSIQSHFAHTEITNELSELSSIRTQYKINKKKLHHIKRNAFLSQLDLECRSKTHKMETDIIQTKMQRLENERSKIDIFDDNLESKQSINTKKLHNLSYQLSLFSRKKKGSKQSNWHLQTLKDVCQEMNYVRQLSNYQLDLFSAKLEEIYQQQTQIIMSNTLNSQINHVPQITQISDAPKQQQQKPRKHKSPKVKEVSRTEVSDPQFLSSIQAQLKAVQEKNQSSLDITSKYLSSLKKKERRRAHRNVTQMFDSANDMNSLFSIS